MTPQNYQYSYRNIDDSSIWAAKSIYLMNSTILVKLRGIYGNLMKFQKWVEFRHFPVFVPFLAEFVSKYLCKCLGFHRFLVSASWSMGILIFTAIFRKLPKNQQKSQNSTENGK